MTDAAHKIREAADLHDALAARFATLHDPQARNTARAHSMTAEHLRRIADNLERTPDANNGDVA